MFPLLKFSIASTVVAVLAVGSLGGLNLYTYKRFTHELPLGSLRFERQGERLYRAHWTPVTGEPRRFALRGDEWQLDVRMIKWTDWLTFLGEDPLYGLDRLSGRYVSIDDARRYLPVAHELGERGSIDVWSFARKAGDWLPGIDAAYGASVFLPMKDGVSYEVSVTRSGLIARQTVDEGVGEQ